MDRISRTLLAAISKPTVCTLAQIATEYEILENNSILAICSSLKQVFDSFEIQCDPPIGEGGLEHQRVLKRRTSEDIVRDRILEAIKSGESFHREFKSSIFISVNKQNANPQLSPSDCVDEKLKEKAAKEIAAFLNAEGGTLLFGVTDDHQIRGCQDDFETFIPGGSNSDKADLVLKQIVDKYFLDSDVIFRHLQISCVEVEGKPVVCVEIASRDRLSFLKPTTGSPLYIRAGTHAIPVPFEKIEDYFTLSRSQS